MARCDTTWVFCLRFCQCNSCITYETVVGALLLCAPVDPFLPLGVQRLLCYAVYLYPSSPATHRGSILHQLPVRKQVWQIAALEFKRFNGTKSGLFHRFAVLMASLIKIKTFSNQKNGRDWLFFLFNIFQDETRVEVPPGAPQERSAVIVEIDNTELNELRKRSGLRACINNIVSLAAVF